MNAGASGGWRAGYRGTMTARLHVHTTGERCPVEVLVFTMDPADVDRFLAIDHDVWTLGEAEELAGDAIPFLSKEVWLDDSRPGEVTIVFVWPDQATWDAVGATDIQQGLQAEFDERLGRPYQLVREIHIERDGGLHRWSRFSRPG